MRRFKGRSSQGCRPCKERHVKCDEVKPLCGRCLRNGISCEPGRTQFAARPPSSIVTIPRHVESAPARTQLEKNTFRQFVLRMAPIFGDFKERGFWIHTLLPAAQSHDSVFDATIAYAALFGLPYEDAPYSLIVSERSGRYSYQKAIRWYSQSVKDSLVVASNELSVSTISLILVQIIVFTHIELRQGHVNNAKRLIKSAFAIVQSNSSHLWNCKDSTVLSVLKVLIEMPLLTMCDSFWIPTSHRDNTITLALKLSSDMPPAASKSYQLQLELDNILYDLNDMSAGLTLPEAAIDERLLRWHLAYLKFKSTTDFQQFVGFHDNTMFRMYHWCKLLRCALQNKAEVGKDELRTRAQEMFSAFLTIPGNKVEQDIPNWTSKQKSNSPLLECPMPILEGGIAPACLALTWYIRDECVRPFIDMGLSSFLHLERTKAVTHTILQHIEELLATAPGKATGIELELFGKRPRTLRWCQVAAYANYFFRGGHGEISSTVYDGFDE